MKKLSAMITLILCLFLVTSTVSAVSLAPTNVIEMTFFEGTKTMEGVIELHTLPDQIGGVAEESFLSVIGESEAPVVCTLCPDFTVLSCKAMTNNIYGQRWKEHPSFLGIA